MDKKCSNCRHFRKGSVEPTRPEHVWGDCLKAKAHYRGAENTGLTVAFTWADGYCEDFEPSEAPKNNQNAGTR